ncbi:hypothetical protein [Actinokineospora bangkokensis]|uniref:Uncharacterized protein n=1 Tax=Actinokineospora bangkokensis TaxID=1193682 RepID=A0A1Q9LIH5_9PSEU|nr:hypothetical protein [Actinokineospora bangkokensis]OLR91841.1 hypothetical protein BJP25_23670 [Actinokineospora bangkokensis]
MTARTEAVDAILAALRHVPGVRPAAPVTGSWVPFEADAFAIDIDDRGITVHLVVLAFPLAPLLATAGEAVREAVRGTAWEAADIHLVAADVDKAAFDPSEPGELDRTVGA